MICGLTKQLLVSLHHHVGAAAEGLMPRTAQNQALLYLTWGHLCGIKILGHHSHALQLHEVYQEHSTIFYAMIAANAVGGEELMHALCAEPADDLTQRKAGPIALPSL